MKITYLLAALMLVPSFTTRATTHLRTNESSNQAEAGPRPTVGGGRQGYGGQGRDDWPANMMLDNFQTHAESAARKMVPTYAI